MSKKVFDTYINHTTKTYWNPFLMVYIIIKYTKLITLVDTGLNGVYSDQTCLEQNLITC